MLGMLEMLLVLTLLLLSGDTEDTLEEMIGTELDALYEYVEYG